MSDNADQADFWSGPAGGKWVTHQAMLDQQMLPVLEGVLTRAELAPDQQVLDVGCGTGQSTLLAAEAVGTMGHVVGADISPPMLALARERARGLSNVSFVGADVAAHNFEPQQFDRVISRFGVMFFADPVAAFTNIAAAMKPGALMAFASWGQIDRNPWFTLPAKIAREEIGTPPKSDPDAPGPFAFRDVEKVTRILRAAGLADVHCDVVDLRLSLPGGARDIGRLTSYVGSASATLSYFEADEAGRAALEVKLAEGFAQFPDEEVPAQINYFTCRA